MLGVFSATGLGLVFACLGAFLFHQFGIPLPYILGALTGSAISRNLVGSIAFHKEMRRGGQLVIGASVGSLLEPDSLYVFVQWLPLMLFAALTLIIIGIAISRPVGLIAKVDKLTALLSCLPAGMADMSSLARELGARDNVVATIHALRVILLLSVLPFFVGATTASLPGHYPDLTLSQLCILTMLLISSFVIAYAVARCGILNPWVVTPMVLALLAVTIGATIPVMPRIVVVAAQVAIGLSLGAQFDLEALKDLPRVGVAGILSTALLTCAAFFIISPALARFSNLDRLSALLSVAPGGLGEMIASAKALGLASSSVASFQFIRSLTTNMLVPILIRYLIRSRNPA
jgi:membrane AbrB-like protein